MNTGASSDIYLKNVFLFKAQTTTQSVTFSDATEIYEVSEVCMKPSDVSQARPGTTATPGVLDIAKTASGTSYTTYFLAVRARATSSTSFSYSPGNNGTFLQVEYVGLTSYTNQLLSYDHDDL